MKTLRNEREIERKILLESQKSYKDKFIDENSLRHPVMSISDKATVQYNKRKEFNDADIQRLLNYKIAKNKSYKRDIHSINHINNLKDIIDKKGNKKDTILCSYNNLFEEQNKIMDDDKDTNLFDKNGKFKNVLGPDIDPYKKYCNLEPIIEFEINHALKDKSRKNGEFFWYKSDKKPIEKIDIMNDDLGGSFIPDLMKNSKILKPSKPSYNNDTFSDNNK